MLDLHRGHIQYRKVEKRSKEHRQRERENLLLHQCLVLRAFQHLCLYHVNYRLCRLFLYHHCLHLQYCCHWRL